MKQPPEDRTCRSSAELHDSCLYASVSVDVPIQLKSYPVFKVQMHPPTAISSCLALLIFDLNQQALWSSSAASSKNIANTMIIMREELSFSEELLIYKMSASNIALQWCRKPRGSAKCGGGGRHRDRRFPIPRFVAVVFPSVVAAVAIAIAAADELFLFSAVHLLIFSRDQTSQLQPSDPGDTAFPLPSTPNHTSLSSVRFNPAVTPFYHVVCHHGHNTASATLATYITRTTLRRTRNVMGGGQDVRRTSPMPPSGLYSP